MSTATLPVCHSESETALSRGRVGMWCLILAESAIFLIFVAAYIFYIGKSQDGPTPAQILTVPIFITVCLLSSSLTIHGAVAALRAGRTGRFRLLWFLTLALGATFLIGTGREWYHLIYTEGFTVSTNLFGTTFYSLVGLHASHVLFGLIALLTVMVLSLFGKIRPEHCENCEVLAMYWHFVDAVWVVVFSVVYLLGR